MVQLESQKCMNELKYKELIMQTLYTHLNQK